MELGYSLSIISHSYLLIDIVHKKIDKIVWDNNGFSSMGRSRYGLKDIVGGRPIVAYLLKKYNRIIYYGN